MSQESPTPLVAENATQEGIQPGLADRAEALHDIAATRANLGQVASGKEVHADVHGNILTESDLAELSSKGHQE